MLLFQTTQQVADSLQVAAEKLDQAIAQADGLDKLGLITQTTDRLGHTGRRTYSESGHCIFGRTFSDPDAEPSGRPGDG